MKNKIILFFAVIISFYILSVPKITLAADWVNIGFSDKNLNTVFVDPKNNQNIIVSTSNTISRSVDGGKNWQPINFSPNTTNCAKFIVKPGSQNEIWAGCSSGVYHSSDSGESFQKPAFAGSNILDIAATKSGAVIASFNANNILLSTDGLIWRYINPPGIGNASFYMNPYEPDSIYAYRNYLGDLSFSKSTDQGLSWTLITKYQPLNYANNFYFFENNRICVTASNAMACSDNGGVSWGAFEVIENNTYYDVTRGVQNPDNPNNLVVYQFRYNTGAELMYSSEDGGTTWKNQAVMPKTTAIVISQGVTFAWSPNPGYLAGIWRNDGIAVVPEYLKKHPVIIVPGILGSWEQGGKWVLDPFFHTYDDLFQSLKANGLEEGKYLFSFPYDWHKDNNVTAVLLKQKINEAKLASGCEKVDIVAHSMGGLVARAYAESDYYGGDVNQIIFLGTPHLGSAKSYVAYETGDLVFANNVIVGNVFKYIFGEEAKKNNYNGQNKIFDYIHAMVPSLEQLLPITSYLERASYLIPYPDNYPRNYFLENLDARKGLLKERDIITTNIIGVISNSTIVKYGVIDSNHLPLWSDGELINYYIPFGVPSAYYTIGDQTVTQESASVVADKVISFNDINHTRLPKPAEIIKCIEDQLNIDSKNVVSTDQEAKGLLFFVHSPVKLLVADSAGKRLGFDPDTGLVVNEIAGASYFHEGNIQLAFLPGATSGEFEITAVGTDQGGYEIETHYVDETAYIDLESRISSETTIGEVDEFDLSLDISDNSMHTEYDDQTPPTTEVQINGNKIGDYYNSDVTINLTATDDESSLEKIEYSLDGVTWQKYDEPVVISNEGESTFYCRSTDKAGNIEEAKNVVYKIDKINPNVIIELTKSIFTRWDKLKIICSISDNYSGIDTSTVKLDGQIINCESEINLSKYSLGQHAISYEVKDMAGNISNGLISFVIYTDYKNTEKDFHWLYHNKHFKNYGSAISIFAKLEVAQLFSRIGWEMKEKQKLKECLGDLEKAYKTKKITEFGYTLLKEDINYLLEVK